MNQSFDWNNFDLVEPEQAAPVAAPRNQIEKSSRENQFDWGSFSEAKEPEKKKSFLEDIPRHAARTGSRIVETIAGMPGDIANFLKYMVSNVPGVSGLVGEAAKKYIPEQFKRSVEGKPGMLGSIPQLGSEELKQASEQASGGFTEAKSPEEAKSDEIFQDITALMMPIKGKLPGFARTLGTEVAAQLAKEGTKLLGGSENTQNLAKAAAMFGAGILRPGKVNGYVDSLYEKSNSLLPEGAQVSGKKLSADLDKLIVNLEKGIETTDKIQVIKPARQLLSKVQNGKINVEELVSAKRDINKLRGDPATVKGAKKLLSSIGKQVDEAIDLYKPQNPRFVNSFREANEAFGTIAQSKKVSSWLNNLSKTMKLGSGLGLLFEAHQAGFAPAAAAAASGYGALKSSELLYRIMKSPVLRRHYFDVLKNGMRENTNAAVKSLALLDYELSNRPHSQKDKRE